MDDTELLLVNVFDLDVRIGVRRSGLKLLVIGGEQVIGGRLPSHAFNCGQLLGKYNHKNWHGGDRVIPGDSKWLKILRITYHVVMMVMMVLD